MYLRPSNQKKGREAQVWSWSGLTYPTAPEPRLRKRYVLTEMIGNAAFVGVSRSLQLSTTLPYGIPWTMVLDC